MHALTSHFSLPRLSERQLWLIGGTLAAVALVLIAGDAWAATEDTTFADLYTWFVSVLEGTGGRTAAVIGILVAVFASAVAIKFVGAGTVLGIVLFAAFGVTVINNIFSAVV